MACAWRETNLCQRKCYSTQARSICNHLHHSWKSSSSVHPLQDYISSALCFLYFFPKQLQLATIKERIAWTSVASPLSFNFLKLDRFSCGLETNSSCSYFYFLQHETETDIHLHWIGHCLETFHETLAPMLSTITHLGVFSCVLCLAKVMFSRVGASLEVCQCCYRPARENFPCYKLFWEYYINLRVFSELTEFLIPHGIYQVTLVLIDYELFTLPSLFSAE